jgi:hypothetical protein
MITLNFSPVRADTKTTANLTGTVLTVNGQDFDLSLIEDGASGTHEVLQEFSRTGDDYELTLVLTHGANAPYETRFPEQQIINDSWVLEYDFGGVKNDVAE